MKTVSLTLKRKVLVIELPRLCDYNLYADVLYIFDNENNKNHRLKGSYTLLGSPDDISNNDVKDLFDDRICGNQWCENGKIPQDYGEFWDCEFCESEYLKAFFFRLESEIYWENPHGRKVKVFSDSDELTNFVKEGSTKEQWQEAESRTFDRTRTLIFVEN